MQRFGELLDSLVFQPARNEKLRLIVHYLKTAPDPDRGYAMAALTGALDLPNAKPAVLRALGAAQTDEVLFALSYDYVGDLAEALALVWRGHEEGPVPTLAEVVTTLQGASVKDVPEQISSWLNRMDATGRWALLKLITGALRVGVSARLAKTALAQFGEVELDEIEQLWHGRAPPYTDLFLWLIKQAERPHPLNLAFRPFMLAHPLEESEIAQLPAEDFRAEWKWDGIRVQLVAENGQGRIYSRGGEEIGKAFPDILAAMNFSAVLDGELLIAEKAVEDGLAEVASFNKLQQRLNRKTVTPMMLEAFPAHVRLYDLLDDNGEDLRAFPFDERRQRLEAWLQAHPNPRFDLSPLIAFQDWAELAAIRARARSEAIEGLMLKRADSLYTGGRVKGPWYKWKRDPLTIDAVVMYAQRGHGKRSSFYSDYTFGCWRDGETGPELVPVGKAYSGFTDAELKQLDKWVRDHTKNRFGPVREVEIGLVMEVAFDSVQRSNRHKSGVALRFPRIKRLRWDKPPAEADKLETLQAMIVD
jgi:DNA ligase-1